MKTEQELFDEAVDGMDDAPEVEEREEETVDEVEDLPEVKEEEAEEEFDPKSLARAIAQLSKENRDLHGRFGGLNDQIRTLKSELAAAKTVATAVDVAPTPNQVATASKSLEKWDRLKTDFPEWAEGLEEMVASRMPAAKEVKEVKSDPVADPRVDNLQLQIETMRTKEAHPDFDDVIRSDGFQTFMAGLPAQLKALASSPKAEDAIFLLDHYKTTAGSKSASQVVAERKERLRQSASPVRGQATPRRSIKSLDEMSEEQLFNYYASKV